MRVCCSISEASEDDGGDVKAGGDAACARTIISSVHILLSVTV